jgi:beta-glucanase (GH16 family)
LKIKMRGLAGSMVAVVLVLVACHSPTDGIVSGSSTPLSQKASPARTTWSDESNGPANALPDPTKWTYDLGNNRGWDNQELETYTSQNAHMDGDGHLIIRVESTPAGFTSARLKTRGLFAAEFGRLEARIRLPKGQGLWPAFWMLGNTYDGSNWPQCGEIDVMENIGREPSIVRGTVHGPGYSGSAGLSAPYVLRDGQTFSDDFHTFAIQWEPGTIAFFADGNPYHTVRRSSLPSGASWVFDQPFFVLLNVAVGGNYPGPPDSTRFPQDMVADYVRYAPTPTAIDHPALLRVQTILVAP